MEATESLAYFRNEDSQLSLLSVPDLESLEEITDGDVQDLLHLMSTTSSNRAAHADPFTASRSLHAQTELPRPCPPTLTTASNASSSNNSSSDNASVGTAPPRRSPARRDPTRPPITAEFEGMPPLPATSTIAPRPHRAASPTAPASKGAGGGFGVAAAAPVTSPSGPPRLTHVSDTAVLSAEQQRWGCQLVQECWTHQELHNVRWDEQRLLKHGAAYRPRAIASRTAVKMSHTKSLCIALNVDVSIIENAGESQVEDYAEEGSAENARMPSLCSAEAEGWSPLLMWRSPALTPGDAPTVLSQLSQCLEEQYESLAPRPLPTSCCANARPSDLVQTLSDARKDAGDAKVIFHYLARGVPPPRGGNLYLVNNGSAAGGYAGPPCSKLSLDTFRSRVGFPLVFVADCAEAREILNYYIRMCEEQHQQRYFTSSREYQLKSSRQVSAAELDSLADSGMGVMGSSLDRVGSGADLSAGDALRRGRGGAGGIDSTPAPQSAVLQDFYFIGATGSSTSGNSGLGGGAGGGGALGGGGGGLRDKTAGGGNYDDFGGSSPNLARAGGSGGTVGGGSAGALRHHVRLPSDILTSCLTTPLRMAVLWFIAERPELQELHPLLLRLFPGALTDKKTPLGQLQWYLQSIIECIAWSTLSLPEYSRLFREDVYVAPLFRGYILAERIIVGGLDGCLTVYPPVAATHAHPLWATWDNLVERACVSLLRAIHPAPPRCTSVMEFRGWLDETVTSWKYTRPDLLAVPTNPASASAAATVATSVYADGRYSCLPSTPEESAVFMPSLLTESLRGMQAQLDGITQQSFERPRVFFAEIIGLQLPASPASTVWDTSRTAEVEADAERGQRQRSRRSSPASAQTVRLGAGSSSDAGAGRRPGALLLRDVAEQYSNSLRSSFPPQLQQLPPQPNGGGAFSSEGTRTTVSTATSMADLMSTGGSAGTGGAKGLQVAAARAARGQREGGADGGMPARSDSQATLPAGRYQRSSQANLIGLPDVAAAATTANPAAAVVARMDARRSPSKLAARKAEYVTNLYTNATSSGQANSFLYTAGLRTLNSGNDLFGGSPAGSPKLSTTAAPPPPPPPQHTFPFMDRMPLLLQALLVAAHREKATELVCRLVDCGPAAVLQCAEANIYRFVLDRYWVRPDLRFLMPATLFIYCKSCYADPELIGNAKQRDAAVKACAEILQCPVEVPRLASNAGVTVEEAPGAWQSAVLGPYATPYGQRMLAAALLTLIALHSDGGREACHQHGVFQLCCQLLHRTRDDAPLMAMCNMEVASHTAAVAMGQQSHVPAMPPLPRPPSSTLSSNASWSSPLQAQNYAASLAAAGGAAAAPTTAFEEPPPPACVATTYHVTLLTLFVSLLCNWKPPAASEDDGNADNDVDEERETEEEGGDGGGFRSANEASASAQLSPALDGDVHELPPTSPQVLAAGLRMASGALLNFTYSDTSILRGAALRCLMMVLVSPAPSQASRTHVVEVELTRIHRETYQRCELNTDLRLEVLGMCYTTFRWLLEQLREDLPIEEIGQYVAVWVYKWFKLAAQGRTPVSPGIAAGRGTAVSPHSQRSPHQQQQQPYASMSSYQPPLSMSYRGSSVVTPGSVYSHRGSNVLVPAARSVYAGTTLDNSGAGIAGSLANAGGVAGLRQHLTQQDHRRLQSCLPPLSNLVRLFFEHTQDACPYIRTYARKVVMEEFNFLRQSWYDDYDGHDPRGSPQEEEYGAVSGRANRHRHRSRHRGYSARREHARDDHLSGDVASAAVGLGRQSSADPLTASSVDGGGDLATYLPLREMLGRNEMFDDTHEPSGGVPSTTATRQSHRNAAEPHAASTAALAAGPAPEIDDVPDPQPAVLRRFIGRLLRIAAADGPDVSDSPSGFTRTASRRHLDSGSAGKNSGGGGLRGVDDDDDDGRDRGGRREDRVDDYYSGSGSDPEGEGGHGRGGSSSRYRHGDTPSGERGSRRREGAREEGSDGDGDGTLLDSETLALHPLWAMDSTSMTNFAYGALSFLERFMLEKMDDSDPRHPMNLEKENALHHYYQRVERNIRAFAQDEVPGAEVADSERRSWQLGDAAGVNDRTAGSRTMGAAFTPAPTAFRCLGVGDVGQAGVPAHTRRRRPQRGFAHHHHRHSRPRRDEEEEEETGSRVAGNVDVVLFHPSEPIVVTSTTGGLLSVWSYDHLGLPTTGDNDDVPEHAHRHHPEGEEDEEEGAEQTEDAEADGEAVEPAHSARQRRSNTAAPTPPRRRLHAKAQFFLRDVVGRSRSDLSNVARPLFMYDRFNPNSDGANRRVGGGARRQQQLQRGDGEGRRGLRERTPTRHPGHFYRRDEMGGGGGVSRAGAWMDRAEAANAIAALPSSYQHGHPHYYHGVGDLHLVDAAHHPLICAVRRFGAVEVFSHFTDRHRVRRVVTFETARFGQNEGAHECVSSYQSCTGLLYLSNGEGGVSAWDLGNEQRLATLGTLASVDAAASSCDSGGRVSALHANVYTPYEYLVGSYGRPVCLFDMRDGSSAGAARLGYAHPASQFTFGGTAASPFSSLCVRVGYSRRYPDAVVAGYACGTVAVWDRRYAKQPSLLFGTALDAEAGRGGRGASCALSGGAAMLGECGVSAMVRQLDVHPCSKRFLTLTTTPSTLQLVQPSRSTAGRAGASTSSRPTACVVENYNLSRDVPVADGMGDGQSCEPGAACFHEFSPVLCVGAGSSVCLYGTSHLSTMATYMDVDGV